MIVVVLVQKNFRSELIEGLWLEVAIVLCPDLLAQVKSEAGRWRIDTKYMRVNPPAFFVAFWGLILFVYRSVLSPHMACYQPTHDSLLLTLLIISPTHYWLIKCDLTSPINNIWLYTTKLRKISTLKVWLKIPKLPNIKQSQPNAKVKLSPL